MHTEFILLTNVASPIWQRAIGAYQVAHHCRQAGITCQVIDFTDLFKIEELEEIITSLIDKGTLALGISTTFFYNQDTRSRFVSAVRTLEQILSDKLRNLIIDIKARYPHIKIVGGGANSYHIEDDPLFDVIFHGYSEQSVVEYLQSLKGDKPQNVLVETTYMPRESSAGGLA